jgi:hypothetical protein
MQFGRVKIGDHYSVNPEATLGPTQGRTKERTRAEKIRNEKCEQRRRESKKRATKKRLASLEGQE